MVRDVAEAVLAAKNELSLNEAALKVFLLVINFKSHLYSIQFVAHLVN